jgi:hypothetical protein
MRNLNADPDPATQINADPDPDTDPQPCQNVMDPKHCGSNNKSTEPIAATHLLIIICR